MRALRHAAAIAALLLAGCAAEPASLPHVLIVTTRDGQLLAADSVAAGWTRLQYHLDSADAGHNLVLFAVDPVTDTTTLLAAIDTMHASPRGTTALGGHEAGGAVGDTASAWLHLTPGRYLLACLTRDSSGHRHAGTGEHRWVEAVATADSAGGVHSKLELRMTDYAYGAVPDWPSGPQILRIVNAGHEDHLVLLERLHPGVDFQQWVDDAEGTRSEPVGGMTRLGAGREFFLELDLPPGEYMVLCLIPDGPSGKSHLELGMVRQFTVGAPVTPSGGSR